MWHKKSKSASGFTLIEILVAASIIALLSTIGFVSYQAAGRNARDAKRKADLEQIRSALELYKADNGTYPPAGSSCPLGSNCYVYSDDSPPWIPALVPNYMQNVPVDPKNIGAAGPWWAGNYRYAYGNVTADGLGYDLMAQLESTGDKDRCGVRGYKNCGGHISAPCTITSYYWCPGTNPPGFFFPVIIPNGAMFTNQSYQAPPP
ncbi:type II secretion system protein [Candidatus Gottesmanbacteria bacterium]|nr:type II secretion system protein [Candidatus Gottesmanbacteria bacterium]